MSEPSMEEEPMPMDMGASDPMMGGQDPLSMGSGDPNGMGSEPSMDGGQEPMMPNGDDDELMSVINSLSVEDKAAVLKYAKSMEKDSEQGMDDMNQDQNMAMESIGANDEPRTRDNKKIPKQMKGRKNPFISKF